MSSLVESRSCVLVNTRTSMARLSLPYTVSVVLPAASTLRMRLPDWSYHERWSSVAEATPNSPSACTVSSSTRAVNSWWPIWS